MSDRREAGVPVEELRTVTRTGTHAMGGFAGTISFVEPFAGTPTVMITPLAGSSSFGRTIPVGVRSRFSGSFTYRGSPGHGSFSWMAYGPARGNV